MNLAYFLGYAKAHMDHPVGPPLPRLLRLPRAHGMIGMLSKCGIFWTALCTCQLWRYSEILGHLLGSYPSAWKQGSWRSSFAGLLTMTAFRTSWHGLLLWYATI